MPAILSRQKRSQARTLRRLAHDLRQPLHALTLYLSALDRRIDNAEARVIIAKMDAAALELSRRLDAISDETT